MSIRLIINATAIFETVAQARTVAQASEMLLATAQHTAGGANLFDFATDLDVAVHAPVVDRSGYVQGGQAAQEKLARYTAELAKRADHPVDATAWQSLFDNAKRTGEIDLALLTEIATVELGLTAETAVPVVADAIGRVNAAIAEREYRTLMAPKKVR